MIYTVLSLICLSLLLFTVIYLIFHVAKMNRSERISFVRSFKFGNCAIIYPCVLPLLMMGKLYEGESFFKSFMASVDGVLELVVLKFNTADIASLLNDNIYYKITIYAFLTAVFANLALFTVSLVFQKLWAWYGVQRWQFTKKDKLLIIGNNKNNHLIYRSSDEKVNLLTDNFSKPDEDELYIKGIHYTSRGIESTALKQLNKSIKSGTKLTVIINTEDDDTNIKLCHLLIDAFKSNKDVLECKNKALANDPDGIKGYVGIISKFRIYVFGQPKYQDIYNELVESPIDSEHPNIHIGCLHYINKFKQTATGFIDSYPFSKYLTEEQIDFESSTVRPDTNINVVMLGFGKSNQQIFLTSVANNQFITEENGKIKLKQVNYEIFDKNYNENTKNLNHSYYRFKNEFANADESLYLPLPELPAHESYHYMDINSPEFYNSIQKIVTASEKDANFVIIGFGSDLENIDMAQKLLQKGKEWNVKSFNVFVKVRSGNRSCDIFKEAVAPNCRLIGDEASVVYNIKKIENSTLERMAMMRNRIYDIEYLVTSSKTPITEKQLADSAVKSDYNWYTKHNRLKRESNIYASLSLRSKLNLMGLDYKKGEGISEEEYLKIYAGTDLPDELKDEKGNTVMAENKKVLSYDIDFKQSRRKNLAIHEHYRWNSYMISKGNVPATRDTILADKANGRIESTRLHGNLTTFDGLVEFRRLIAERDGKSELKTDVIKYDYQLLDDAYWLITENGFGVIKKQ